MLNQIEKGEAKPNPILKEDLDKIIFEYKEKEKKGELKYRLYWIILSLKLTTNLRINEILSIKVKDIKRINDKNVLMVLRKSKGREKKKYYPNQYVMKLINLAVEITEFLRNGNKNDKKINEYVFLNTSIKGGIRVISRDVFYRDFRRTIKNLDLSQSNYTVYNLRDTFMNNIFEEGKKQGVNIFDIHKVTGHAHMETTIKHYRKSNIQNYLEAMFYIKLDNVIVNGTVVENPRESISNEIHSLKSVTVRNENGYCESGTCIAEKDLDCLMCPNFITTLDRIPYIIKSIKQIEKDIKQSVYDEKDELIHIKKLYVAYLKKLYELKEERSKNA
ncbi:tyrosine-type recombinase/integrase [Bacillus sp. AFS059628]|uniref:tyrosine-type recombinase/integrase n=1 Tax=Bacillus sp. AFS059628 TaxID=2033508 RepID=UPI0015D509AE|nr:tyrosine-type recombinase/integrase [Bacillus sp. AFS059628]